MNLPAFVGLTAAAVILGGLLAAAAARQSSATGPESQSMPTESKPAPAEPGATRLSRAAFDITPLSQARVDELAKGLNDEERRVLLRKGTEPAFCGNLLDNKKSGVYVCRLCSLPLFDSSAKFNSGTGWPSFFQPFDREHIRYVKDSGHGMVRMEILCARCGGHLGHVFDDAHDQPTGLRYCLNSASLSFLERAPDGAVPWPAGEKGFTSPIASQTAYFAGGCFWGVEDRFQQTPGVFSAVSGYMGGHVKNPTYKQVCSADTGHAEAVMITYDPAKVTYRELLEKFFKYHNPTQLNRQGPDVGPQYRSAIFAADAAQLEEVKKFIAEQQATDRFKGKTIVTQVVDARSLADAGRFHAAEEYHQDYHEKHGGHCEIPAD